MRGAGGSPIACRDVGALDGWRLHGALYVSRGRGRSNPRRLFSATAREKSSERRGKPEHCRRPSHDETLTCGFAPGFRRPYVDRSGAKRAPRERGPARDGPSERLEVHAGAELYEALLTLERVAGVLRRLTERRGTRDVSPIT